MATIALSRPFSATALTEDQFDPQWEAPPASSAALTGPREQSFTFAGKANTYRVLLRDHVLPAWVKPTISGFIGVQSLADNWDSYGGKAVNRELIERSLTVLVQIMRADSPAPAIVPLGDGGLQIEWHRRQQDLEIVVAADEAPRFYYKNRATGAEQEGLANQLGTLVQLLSNLL